MAHETQGKMVKTVTAVVCFTKTQRSCAGQSDAFQPDALQTKSSPYQPTVAISLLAGTPSLRYDLMPPSSRYKINNNRTAAKINDWYLSRKARKAVQMNGSP